MPGLQAVLVMACVPIVKILIMCGIGTFLALPSVNVFPLDARKHLNKLVYLVFTPALVFTRLAEAVTLHQLIAWWYMPINVLFCFTLGALLGSLVVKYCKPPKHLNHLTIACCSAGNTGNLLMVLIPGICIEKDSPFGDSNVCSENGLAYVSFGMWMAIVLVWTFIHHLMKPIHGTYELGYDNSSLIVANSSMDNTIMGHELLDEPSLIHSNKMTPNETLISSIHSTSTITTMDHEIFSLQSRLMKIGERLHLQEICTPPTIAAFAALVIGACAPLKALCFGPQAPLRFLTDCAKILGDAMIPCMILILGGNLAMGAGDSDMQMLTIIGIVMTRFVALPIIGIVIINIIQKMGVLPIDPLFKLVLILQFCMPTGISLGTIAQLHNYCEKEMAVVLFWLYITSAFFISIWATVALYLL
ncbi:unnamed protein product [Sphagnum jensenii]|uniref:Auxin efflux carrier family protein n=1 Tax=Sphagnum jensenii TaxID=128206 RepID=A0ABP0X0T0_9BRYO